MPLYGWVTFHYVDGPHLVYPFISWWTFGLFLFLATVNNAAVNICFQVFCAHMFSFLLGINLGMELLGHMVTLFHLWRRCQTVFQASCTIFLVTSDAENLSMCLLAICMSSFGEKCIQILCRFLNLYFYYWVVGVLCIFWTQIPYQISNLQIHSLILWGFLSFSWYYL